MKSRYLLSMVLAALFMVGAYSCTTLQDTTDGYGHNGMTSRNSSYYDPFYNSGAPVLVRDAYTGRVFYVYPNNGLSTMNNYGMYDNRFNNNGFNNNRFYNDRSHARPSAGRPQMSEGQRDQQKGQMQDSRRKILGGGH